MLTTTWDLPWGLGKDGRRFCESPAALLLTSRPFPTPTYKCPCGSDVSDRNASLRSNLHRFEPLPAETPRPDCVAAQMVASWSGLTSPLERPQAVRSGIRGYCDRHSGTRHCRPDPQKAVRSWSRVRMF